MSLDIIAYDPKETKARKNKFKAKYGISYDKFDDEMLEPDEDKAWYDNLVQGAFDEIKAEEQRRKEARQKELTKRRKQAEAHRKWKTLAKNA